MKRVHSRPRYRSRLVSMVSRINGRKRGATRQERKKARARLKKMMEELNRRFSRQGTPSSQRGRARTMFVSPGGKKGIVGGFLDATPDPPKMKSRNKRNSWPPSPSIESQVVEQDAESPPLARRAGAPTTAFHRLRLHGKAGVWLSRNAYRRLVIGRERVEQKLKQIGKQVRQLYQRPPKNLRRAAASLLLASGVSARKVPYVLAVAGFYHIGFVPEKHLFASQTALDDVRVVGACLKNQLVAKIGQGKHTFFVGLDTSSRGGSLGAYVISSQDKIGKIEQAFFGFDRPSSGSAQTLADGLLAVVDVLTKAGGIFGGFGSDAPATMVGPLNGVAAHVMAKVGYVRHDTCEFHASARVLAILEKVFPGQMNNPSTTQFWYLAWYILNSDWKLFRGRIVDYLQGDPSPVLLGRFSGNNKKERVDAALVRLGKPDKPMAARWRTMADTMWFVDLYWEALQTAFESERQTGGTNAKPGSSAAMCNQWIKWSGSKKLRALCNVALEFVNDIWWPFEQLIGISDEEFGVAGCNRVHSRPRRVLEQLMLVENRLADMQSLESLPLVVAAFGEERKEEVVHLYRHLYQLTKESILRNSGRYLSGIHALGGLADPDFAPVIFEALSHFLGKRRKPLQTAQGKRLLQCFSDGKLGDAEREVFEQLIDGDCWTSVELLVAKLRESRRGFVAMIKQAPRENHLLWTLWSWRAALSNTQRVEKSFLDFDHQTRGAGNGKSKAAEPAGKGASIVTVESKVLVKSAMNDSVEAVLARRKEPKEQKVVASKEDIVKQVGLDFRRLDFSRHDVERGRAAAQSAQEFYREPRRGISTEIQAVFAALEKDVEGWKGPRLVFADLLRSGERFDISLSTECSADCLLIEKLSKKGRKPDSVICASCKRPFHLKCMASEGVLAAGTTEEDLHGVNFLCGGCGGTIELNKQAVGAPVVVVDARPHSKKARTKKSQPN